MFERLILQFLEVEELQELLAIRKVRVVTFFFFGNASEVFISSFVDCRLKDHSVLQVISTLPSSDAVVDQVVSNLPTSDALAEQVFE